MSDGIGMVIAGDRQQWDAGYIAGMRAAAKIAKDLQDYYWERAGEKNQAIDAAILAAIAPSQPSPPPDKSEPCRS